MLYNYFLVVKRWKQFFVSMVGGNGDFSQNKFNEPINVLLV